MAGEEVEHLVGDRVTAHSFVDEPCVPARADCVDLGDEFPLRDPTGRDDAGEPCDPTAMIAQAEAHEARRVTTDVGGDCN